MGYIELGALGDTTRIQSSAGMDSASHNSTRLKWMLPAAHDVRFQEGDFDGPKWVEDKVIRLRKTLLCEAVMQSVSISPELTNSNNSVYYCTAHSMAPPDLCTARFEEKSSWVEHELKCHHGSMVWICQHYRIPSRTCHAARSFTCSEVCKSTKRNSIEQVRWKAPMTIGKESASTASRGSGAVSAVVL